MTVRKTALLPLALILLFPLTLAGTTPAWGEVVRTVVSESEPNNDVNSADMVPRSTTGVNVTGEIGGGDVSDYFRIDLQGGAGTVDRLTINVNSVNSSDINNVTIFFVVYSFYPTSSDLHVVIVRAYYRYFPLRSFYFNAAYTGTYYLELRAYPSNMPRAKYDLLFTVSQVTPPDNYNDLTSPLLTSSDVIGERVDENEDEVDAYKFIAPDPDHWPTNVSFTLSVDNSYSTAPSNPTPGNVYYYTYLNVYMLYPLKNNPSQMRIERIYRITDQNWVRDSLQTQPVRCRLVANFTEAYVLVIPDSEGADPANPNQIYFSSYMDGWAVYSMRNLVVKPEIPNFPPKLHNGSVRPEKGRTTDSYTFEVYYWDFNNDTPSYVYVTVDGVNYRMLRAAGEDGNFSNWERYVVEIPGRVLGEGRHTFNFSASDGKLSAVGDVEVHQGPIIDDSLPPVKKVPEVSLKMQEDSGEKLYPLSSWITDPNEGEELTFYIWTGTSWGIAYDGEVVQGAIYTDNDGGEKKWYLKVSPKKDAYGNETLLLNATDPRGLTLESPLEVKVCVQNVNDPPRLIRVGGFDVSEEKYAALSVKQDSWLTIPVMVVDPDNENVSIIWNGESAMHNPVEGENYYVDDRGWLHIRPTDEDVPGIKLTVRAIDPEGEEDSVLVDLKVINVNDPPQVRLKERLEVYQGDTVQIIPWYTDPDLDSGDSLVFTTNALKTIPGLERGKNFFFDPDSGNLTVVLNKEAMVGVWNITITATDLEGLTAQAWMILMVNNVNDPPVAGEVTAYSPSVNLTVVAYADKFTDPDGDPLTYIWDFGDGTPPVRGENLTSVAHTYARGGVYTIILVVSDGELQSDEVSYTITVVEPPPPEDGDGDGIKDSWELKYHLDPEDPSDAGDDPDGDGLTNLQEYLNNTNPFNPDTDGDGYSDGYEVERGTDPLKASSHPEELFRGWWLGNSLILIAIAVVFLISLFMAFRSWRVYRKSVARLTASMTPQQTVLAPSEVPPQEYMTEPGGVEEYPTYQEQTDSGGVEGWTAEQTAGYGMDYAEGYGEYAEGEQFGNTEENY